MKTIILLTSSLFLLLGNIACSSKTPKWDEVHKSKEFYHSSTSTRHAQEPVYGRMTWSHLPEPQVQVNKSDAPLINPKFSFELPNSSLQESIEALSQSMGYRWDYPKDIGKRPVSINMVGTVYEILDEIEKQAHVQSEVDNKERVIHVQDGG